MTSNRSQLTSKVAITKEPESIFIYYHLWLSFLFIGNLLELHQCKASSSSENSLKKKNTHTKNNLSNNSKILAMFKRKVIKSMDEDVLLDKINKYFSLGKKSNILIRLQH